MINQNNTYSSKRHSLNYDIYSSSTFNDFVIQKDINYSKQQGQINCKSNFNKQNQKTSNRAIQDLLKLYDNKNDLNFNSTIKKDKKVLFQTENYNKNDLFMRNSYNQEKNRQPIQKKINKEQYFDKLRLQIQMLIKQNNLLKIQNQHLRKEVKARKSYSLDLQNQNKRLKQKLQQDQYIQIKLANFKLQFQSQSHSQQVLIEKLQKQLSQKHDSSKRYQQFQKKQINQLISLYQSKLFQLREQLQFNKTQYLHEIENTKTLIQCKYEKIIIVNQNKHQQKIKQLEDELKMKQELLQEYKKYADGKNKIKQNQSNANHIQLKIQI